MSQESFFDRLKNGLARTRAGWRQRFESLFKGSPEEGWLEDVEELLMSADVGVVATRAIVDSLRLQEKVHGTPQEMVAGIKKNILRLLTQDVHRGETTRYSHKPWVVMFVGVNGVGKTTTIGKLAYQLRHRGKRVVLAAADTFRAGAIEQLEIWGERAGADVVKHGAGQDPSGVAYDALHAAIKRQADAVFIDTAGRLHTKVNLVEELKKMRRVVSREREGAPHETLMVVDATTGQNALAQARVFQESVGVSGIILTKLDGTAKGGVVVGIQQQLRIPVEYVGVGEGVDDLQVFDPKAYVDALFD